MAKESGFRIIFNDLPKIRASLTTEGAALVQKTALNISRNARLNAPVKTGFLRSSIKARKVAELTYYVTVYAPYGIYVEMGTRHMKARPFLLPAFDAEKTAFIAEWKKLANGLGGGGGSKGVASVLGRLFNG